MGDVLRVSIWGCHRPEILVTALYLVQFIPLLSFSLNEMLAMKQNARFIRVLASGQSLLVTPLKYCVSQNTVLRILRENIAEPKFFLHKAKESLLRNFNRNFRQLGN